MRSAARLKDVIRHSWSTVKTPSATLSRMVWATIGSSDRIVHSCHTVLLQRHRRHRRSRTGISAHSERHVARYAILCNRRLSASPMRAQRDMTQKEPENSQRPSGLKIGAWVALSLAIALAAAILAGRVPAVALGLGIAVILMGVGIPLIWRRPIHTQLEQRLEPEAGARPNAPRLRAPLLRRALLHLRSRPRPPDPRGQRTLPRGVRCHRPVSLLRGLQGAQQPVPRIASSTRPSTTARSTPARRR